MMASMRNIHVVPYDPAWQAKYEREAARLHDLFGALLVAIHHIGSTSVPGLHAKLVIDIMPVVRDITQVERYNDAMVALGYEARGENGIPGRRYFAKEGDAHRSHHVHCYEPDHSEVAAHLNFRDYLRTHPETAAAYGALKQQLAMQYTNDIHGYMDGKDAFVKSLIAKANIWAQNRGKESLMQ